MKTPNQEEVWDKISEEWNKCRKKTPKFVIGFLKNKKGRLLDLGCGSGRNFIKSDDRIVYGIDFSKEMLKFANKNAQKNKINVKLTHASAEKLPFDNNFFDNALYSAVLHCLETPEKRKKSLKELFRVLKKGGKALIIVWSRNHQRIKNAPKNAIINWTINEKKYGRCYYIYEKDEIRQLLEKMGFNVLNLIESKNFVITVQKP